MIDSNAAITVPLPWLKVGENGPSANNLGKTLETISWQGFEQEGDLISWQGFVQEGVLIRFGPMKQQSSSMMRLHQAESMILIWGSK
jgi:hypothetical protein